MVIPATGCAPKRTADTTTTSSDPTVAELQQDVKNLQNAFASLPDQAGGDYDSDIAALYDEIALLDEQFIDTASQDDISAIQAEIDGLGNVSFDMPKYALATDIGNKDIEVSIYGAGDYPVIVTLYGDNLKMGEVDIDDDDIAYEFLYGTLTSTNVPLSVSYTSAETGEADPPPDGGGPNPHTHPVIISGLAVEGEIPSYSFNGTMLIVIVEPDDEWEASDTFELDIKDIAGEIYYASATVSAEE